MIIIASCSCKYDQDDHKNERCKEDEEVNSGSTHEWTHQRGEKERERVIVCKALLYNYYC